MDRAVSADVRIRTRSMSNVSTDRLTRRLEHLRQMFRDTSEWADGRAAFGDRVRETINIERELLRRAVMFRTVTDGKHLRVDVFAVPTMGPRPSRKERNETRTH